jgi:predicted metal-dependent phosphoesterase TrpH
MRRIKIDLHSHSTASDGDLPPRAVAELFKRSEIELAALTDHNTLRGLEEFRSSAESLGIKAVTGVEVDLPFQFTGSHARGFDVHMLCYGFDAGDQAFKARATGGWRRAFGLSTPGRSGGNRIREFVEAAHGAGGLVLLAHPLAYPGSKADQERIVYSMKDLGVDGIEAYYSPYDEEERAELLTWARACDFLVSGGSDFHRVELKPRRTEFPGSFTIRRATEAGIEVPMPDVTRLLSRLGPNRGYPETQEVSG